MRVAHHGSNQHFGRGALCQPEVPTEGPASTHQLPSSLALVFNPASPLQQRCGRLRTPGRGPYPYPCRPAATSPLSETLPPTESLLNQLRASSFARTSASVGTAMSTIHANCIQVVHTCAPSRPSKKIARPDNYFFLGADLEISSTLSPGGSDCLSFSAFSASLRTRV